MLGAALDIFSKQGFEYLSRWGHVVVGITWIGLLYYFNFVQVPAFGEMEAAARNNAVDKLASRALWWFRWAAAATFVTGLMILGFQENLNKMSYFKTGSGIAIATGMLFGITMFLNVWGVIWRAQKVVIDNARNVQAGGEANPAAAELGRKALLASRQNTIFSLPLLIFMVGTSHFPYNGLDLTGGKRGLYWAITLIVFAFFELNALGIIGGFKPGGTNLMYDTHKNTIYTGLAYSVLMLIVFAVVFAV
ncbi:MAG: urate hydroxylase PuuD [Acidimicrobiia bacterium]|nr:urate hydroxylase PuuD [Acidimicrobiia bacterium]